MTKEQFEKLFSESREKHRGITKMVIAVQLPNGATEIIINTDQIIQKYSYYLEAYDDEMTLKTNNKIKIVGALFV